VVRVGCCETRPIPIPTEAETDGFVRNEDSIFAMTLAGDPVGPVTPDDRLVPELTGAADWLTEVVGRG